MYVRLRTPPHRDLVHRQTACWAVKHMALGVYGFGCEDALIHLMNYVWPNIFETSPHMMQSFNDAVEGFRVSVGPGKVLQYTLQVRENASMLYVPTSPGFPVFSTQRKKLIGA